MILDLLVDLGREQGDVEVNWVGEGEPAPVGVGFGCEGLEQAGHRFVEILHVGLLAQRIVGNVGLWAQICNANA